MHSAEGRRLSTSFDKLATVLEEGKWWGRGATSTFLFFFSPRPPPKTTQKSFLHKYLTKQLFIILTYKFITLLGSTMKTTVNLIDIFKLIMYAVVRFVTWNKILWVNHGFIWSLQPKLSRQQNRLTKGLVILQTLQKCLYKESFISCQKGELSTTRICYIK